MSKLLSYILVLHVLQFFTVDLVSEEVQWLYWTLSLLLMSCALSIGLYQSLQGVKEKILSLTIALVFIWTTLDFTIIYALQDHPNIDFVRNILCIFFIIIGVPFIVNILIRQYSLENNTVYSPADCYLVYKYPRTLQEYFVALITLPVGQCRLVVRGKEYYFRRGKVVSRKHIVSSHYIYKLIRDVSNEEADETIGIKWSIYRNCFTVFNGFRTRNYE